MYIAFPVGGVVTKSALSMMYTTTPPGRGIMKPCPLITCIPFVVPLPENIASVALVPLITMFF